MAISCYEHMNAEGNIHWQRYTPQNEQYRYVWHWKNDLMDYSKLILVYKYNERRIIIKKNGAIKLLNSFDLA